MACRKHFVCKVRYNEKGGPADEIKGAEVKVSFGMKVVVTKWFLSSHKYEKGQGTPATFLSPGVGTKRTLTCRVMFIVFDCYQLV